MYFLTQKYEIGKCELTALVNYPLKWIWPRLAIAVGNVRNNRTAGNSRAQDQEVRRPTSQEIPFTQATLDLNPGEGLSKREG